MDKYIGIPNSDLHLYIKYANEPFEYYLAYASACVIDSYTLRAVFGMVNYNIAYLEYLDYNDPREFED